jgi:hypothetical protein
VNGYFVPSNKRMDARRNPEVNRDQLQHFRILFCSFSTVLRKDQLRSRERAKRSFSSRQSETVAKRTFAYPYVYFVHCRLLNYSEVGQECKVVVVRQPGKRGMLIDKEIM